jgi:tetratricopeptide (TPR) repeat protein
MVRTRFSATSLAPPPFQDRQAQLKQITGHVEALHKDPQHFKVLEVLGLGGMGKTSLLEELWTRTLEARTPDHLLWVSLEGEGSTNATGPLLAMRDQLAFECLLFDTALLAYWNATGQPLQLARSSRLAESLPVKALELGGGFGGFVLPIGFGVAVFEALKRTVARHDRYKPEEFEEIERLRKRPGELLARLPHYLGSDLKRWIEPSGEWFLAFYDAYDRQRPSTRQASAPWMREFIGTLDQGVHVVSTREPLRWEEDDWGEILDAVPIDELPDLDARKMLRSRLGQLPAPLEDRLVEAARRVPFLLDTVITGYEGLAKRKQRIELEDLPRSPETAVAQFLTHLPGAQRQLAVALATLQMFDERLFAHVVRTLNLQVSLPDFARFVGWYFVEPVSSGLHKTHDLLTAFVREAVSEGAIRTASLVSATDHLLLRCLGASGPDPDEVLPMLRATMAGWRSSQEMPSRSLEALVDVGFLVYDAGYWNELASIASEASLSHEHSTDVVCEFFTALTIRRIVGVEQALERFALLSPRADLLGRHDLSLDLETAYVRGLAGDYAHAREDFRRLADRAVRFNPADRTQRRARLYQGGMLLMDGAFRESSRLLLETYEAVDPDATADWGELVRYRGHAHRFSFALDVAEELYLRAMRSVTEGSAPALLGRLQTNLAETYCWSDPPRALEAAANAAEIHAALGNRIELAKCDTARGVALAKLGEFDQARQVIARATRTAKEVGYQGGLAFALQAMAIAEWLAGDHDGARVTAEQLAVVVERMDTYRHLQAAPLLLMKEKESLQEVLDAADWLDGERLLGRMERCLAAV